jgi:hypothetical protein
VNGKSLIAGKCGYQIRESGEFYIAGPRQVYEGVDFHNPEGWGFAEQSNDYWAVVSRKPDGTWTGYGNTDIRATHGGLFYRTLSKNGACYSGETDAGTTSDGEVLRGEPVRICLWKR